MDELLTAGIDPNGIHVLLDISKVRWAKENYINMLVHMPNTIVKINISQSKRYSSPTIQLSGNSPWWRYEQKTGVLSRFIIAGNEMIPRINEDWAKVSNPASPDSCSKEP